MLPLKPLFLFLSGIVALGVIIAASFTLQGHLPAWVGISKVDTVENKIALTFDDGPNPPYTNHLLKLLDQHRVKATFFFLGRNIEMYRNSALLVREHGHEIGNHGFSHTPLGWKSPQSIEKEIAFTDTLIRSLGYEGTIFFRSPFGNMGLPLWRTLSRLKKTNILYSVATQPPDYFRSSPEHMFRNMIEKIHPGSLILLHDGEGLRPETLFLTDKLLTELKYRGYDFVTVSELLKLDKDI